MQIKNKPIIFGPVPSRRLGYSLGINNLPFKICSYNCIYCQAGKTLLLSTHRQKFYSSEEILKRVEEKLKEIKKKPNYLSFVPEGEPTLDINLGAHIKALKKFKIKIAVFTNSSLLFLKNVQQDLMEADLVSLKIDSLNKGIWQKISQAKIKNFSKIIKGIKNFAKKFKGTLIIEVMLIKGMNDKKEEIEKIKRLLLKIKPAKVFLSIPVRPPQKNWVKGADLDFLKKIKKDFLTTGIKTSLLVEKEKKPFILPNNLISFLDMIFVHPLKEELVKKIIQEKNISEEFLNNLLKEKKIKKVNYQGEVYLVKA